MSTLTRLWSRSSKAQQHTRRRLPRLGVQQLEGREVPAASFYSVLGIDGNDTGGTTATNVAVDSTGNTYMIGAFRGTQDLDPGHSHPGDTDILNSVYPGQLNTYRRQVRPG